MKHLKNIIFCLVAVCLINVIQVSADHTYIENTEIEIAEKIEATNDNEIIRDVETMPFELELIREGKFPTKYEINDETIPFLEEIERNLGSREISFEIENWELSLDELAKLYETTVNMNTSLHYVKNKVNFEVLSDKTINIVPEYKDGYARSTKGYLANKSEFDREVSRILSCVDSSMSDLEKALAVHEHFVRNYEYDLTYSIYDFEELFVEKTGVCQSYADGYTYIMNECLGIECYTLSSYDMNHAWNVIKIDGKWYHVDVTWDDPLWVGSGDWFGATRHEYFLLSSKAIRDEEHGHDTYDWVVWALEDLPQMNSTKYDEYLWTETESPFIYYNNKWFYKQYGYIYTIDFLSEECEEVIELEWFSNDIIDIYGDTVFFLNEGQINLYPINGKGYRILEGLEDNIYGMRRNGNVIEYVLYDDDTIYELDLTKLDYKVEKPKATIESGDFVDINLSCSNSGVKYYYTTDGTIPTLTSSSGSQITVANRGNYKIKAIATKSGYNNSDVTTIVIKDGKQVVIGDVMRDNYINSKDGIKLNQYLAKWKVELDDDEKLSADIVSDGYINSKDVIKLNQYLAKWNVTLD